MLKLRIYIILCLKPKVKYKEFLQILPFTFNSRETKLIIYV